MTGERPIDGYEIAEGVRIIERRQRRPLHRCRLPGWFARRRLDLGYGSIIECPGCLRQYRFEGDDAGSYWSRHYPQPKTACVRDD